MERVEAELVKIDTAKTNKVEIEIFSKIMEEQAGLQPAHIDNLVRAAGRSSAQPIVCCSWRFARFDLRVAQTA